MLSIAEKFRHRRPPKTKRKDRCENGLAAKSFFEAACLHLWTGPDIWPDNWPDYPVAGLSAPPNPGLSGGRIIRPHLRRIIRPLFPPTASWERGGINTHSLPLPQAARTSIEDLPFMSHQIIDYSTSNHPKLLIFGESEEEAPIYIFTDRISFPLSFARWFIA